MYDISNQIILGIIQGVTEWLPISSSGHLALAEHVLGLRQDLAYDLFLHLASLVVMLLFFRNDIVRLLRSLGPSGSREDRTLVRHVIIATLVTIPVALAIRPLEPSLRSLYWIAAFLGVNALVLVFTKRSFRQHDLHSGIACLIGFVQGLAAIPALSRSGVTIAIALMCGLPRELAFRFSFLIAIPTLAGAIVLTLDDMVWQPLFIIGFITTAIVGYASLAFLKRIVLKDSFHYFWIYNAVLAIIVLGYAVW